MGKEQLLRSGGEKHVHLKCWLTSNQNTQYHRPEDYSINTHTVFITTNGIPQDKTGSIWEGGKGDIYGSAKRSRNILPVSDIFLLVQTALESNDCFT
jgi:hypothetical protein